MVNSLGSYQVISQMGRGSASAVHLARDVRSNEEVVLRIFDGQLSSRAGFGGRLRECIAQVQELNHHHLVKVREGGELDGRAYLVCDLWTGGETQTLLRRNGGVLELDQALALLRDVCSGLAELNAAGIVHADLKPSNIFLNADGRAGIGDVGMAGLVGELRPRRMPVGTLAYCSPEQSRGLDDCDVRSDIYSMGATLYRWLSGSLLFDDPDPLQLLHKVQRAPLPDLEQALPQVPASVRTLIARCCARQREDRPSSPAAVADAVDVIIQELVGQRRAGAAISSLEAILVEQRALRQSIDPQQLRRLTDMVRIRNNGVQAVIRLAPGAYFQRPILELILAEADIRHGLDRAAMVEATRPLERVRQVVVARGLAPTPSRAGRNVHGDPIPPSPHSLEIVVSDDGLCARAEVKPGRPIDKEELSEALAAADLQYGVDQRALARLRQGTALDQDHLDIAHGKPPRPSQDAGWAIDHPQAKPGGPPPLVRRGDVIAHWRGSAAGEDGITVHGDPIPVPEPRQASAQALAGEGCEVTLDRGSPLLMADRDGMVFTRAGGVVVVCEVLDIAGDVDGHSPPVDSNAVVLIRGSVRAGAVIQSSSDVVVLGDVDGGELSAGGDINVAGSIGPEGEAIRSGGELRAHSLAGRPVIAGSLRVQGVLNSARIHVAGDVQAERIVGGEIVCGGAIRADYLGDAEGTSTSLRSGAHLRLSEQQALARLRWQQVSATRQRLLSQRDDLLSEQEALDQRSMRHRSADVTCARALEMMRAHVDHIDGQLQVIRNEAEAMREDIRSRFAAIGDIDHLRESGVVEARCRAYAGVEASVADADVEKVKRSQTRYILRFSAVGG